MQFSLVVGSKPASLGALRHARASSSARNAVLGQRRSVSVAAGPLKEDLSAPSVDGGIQFTAASVASITVWALSALPAAAVDLPAGGPPASSYYVSLGLFVLTVPGKKKKKKKKKKDNIKQQKPMHKLNFLSLFLYLNLIIYPYLRICIINLLNYQVSGLLSSVLLKQRLKEKHLKFPDLLLKATCLLMNAQSRSSHTLKTITIT